MTLIAAAQLTDELAAAGFLLLGGFHRESAGELSGTSRIEFPETLLLIGSTGPEIWPAFSASLEYSDGAPDPLDRYTRRVLGDIADAAALDAVFPFEGPPYYPFQRWALAAGGFSQSPLGVLVHERYGPWAGFRGAFLSSERLVLRYVAATEGPCPTCSDKPCLTACPVDAISIEAGYDVPRCRAHLVEHPEADCLTGCLARHACPFGSRFRQKPEQARFHMNSFLTPRANTG